MWYLCISRFLIEQSICLVREQEFFTSEQVGITYGALRNYGLNFDKPYQNSKCIIRKGILLAKKGNRGKKG